MSVESKIVNALIKDLQSRKFLDHVFAEPQENGEANTNEGMDQETFNSLKSDWRKIIRKQIKPSPQDSGDAGREGRDG